MNYSIISTNSTDNICRNEINKLLKEGALVNNKDNIRIAREFEEEIFDILNQSDLQKVWELYKIRVKYTYEPGQKAGFTSKKQT